MGNSELSPCFALLVCAAFGLLIKLSLRQLMSFLVFILLILSPVLLLGSERVIVWGLVTVLVKSQLTGKENQFSPLPSTAMLEVVP